MTVVPQEQPQAAVSLHGVIWSSLPVSVLSTGHRRLEGEAYLTGGYALRLQIEGGAIPVRRLQEMAEVWQPSRLKGVQVGRQSGVPFFTATQVFDIQPFPRKWLATGRTPAVARRYVKPGWILVTCSGNVGDALISYHAHEGVIISHDLLRVQPRDRGNTGYLYCFLRSRFGRTILRSSQYGKIIKHLEVEHLQDVPVPILGQPLRAQLNERIGRVFRFRDDAFQMMKEAESLYSKALRVDTVPEGEATAFTVRASEMFGGRRRLDGYHYNPMAEAALAALRSSGRPLEALLTLTERIFGVPRFKHVYSNQGIPYLDSEDIFKINPEVAKFIPDVTKKNAARYHVQAGWLLMACSGQLYGLNGSVILATRWHENKIISNHVIRIVPRGGVEGVRPGYLQMVLGHPILGRPLVLRLAFGMEVPEIAPDDLKGFPVARLGRDLENEIADRVERASELRIQADEEENTAVRAIEEELERLLHAEARPRIAAIGESLDMDDREGPPKAISP